LKWLAKLFLPGLCNRCGRIIRSFLIKHLFSVRIIYVATRCGWCLALTFSQRKVANRKEAGEMPSDMLLMEPVNIKTIEKWLSTARMGIIPKTCYEHRKIAPSVTRCQYGLPFPHKCFSLKCHASRFDLRLKSLFASREARRKDVCSFTAQNQPAIVPVPMLRRAARHSTKWPGKSSIDF
jgi:hypothetical protein